MGLHPNSELVGVAWLKAVTGLGDTVATDVPGDQSTWSASGFTQVSAVGGSPGRTFPIAKAVLSLDFWATNPNSGRPPWGKAAQLAEHVRAGVHDHGAVPRIVALPATYNGARVVTAYLLTEPRRIRSDVADLAHYSADLALSWVELPT